MIFPAKAVEELRLHHAHEAGEHHQVRASACIGRDEPLLALALELGLERRRIDEGRRHAEARPEREDAGIGLVRKDAHDARPAEPARRLGLQDRLGVAAPPGTEDDDAHGVRTKVSQPDARS